MNGDLTLPRIVRSILALVVLGGIGSLMGCSDIEPVDDSAMRREPPSLRTLENFESLNALAGKIVWPETTEAPLGMPDDALAWEGELLRANASVLSSLASALNGGGFVFPKTKLDEPMPWKFDEWRRMLHLLLASATNASRADDQPRVVAEMERSFRFARQMENAGGGMVGLMFSRWMRSMCLDWMRRESHRLPTATRDSLAAAMTEMGVEPVRAAYRQEYVMTATMLGDTDAMGLEMNKGGAITKLFSGVAYQPEKTKQRFLDSIDELMTQLDRPCWERESPPELDSTVRDFWRPNITGRILHAIAAPSLGTGGFVDCEDAADTRATLVIGAIAAYERDLGARPASLSELTPDYLERVPTDPWSPIPDSGLRFNGSTTVYSVGRNGRDDGGEGEPNTHRGPDQAYPIAAPIDR